MDERTRRQLLRINTEFYRAHAAGFDASRGHQPWPGWTRLLDSLPAPARSGRLRVLDVGCGNARLATFLADAEFDLDYVGIDANAALLESARARLREDVGERVELIEADFLSSGLDAAKPGASLPAGPFDLVALFGVLHHIPGVDWRDAFLIELALRLRPGGGVLAIAAWQFAERARFDSKRVDWGEVDEREDGAIDAAKLDAGDFLLRFGSDPALPPRYCHQVADAEMDEIGERIAVAGIEMDDLDDYRADGRDGDLNRYRVFRRR